MTRRVHRRDQIRVLCLLATGTYLAGAIPIAALAGWLHRVDLRAVGSRSVTSSNLLPVTNTFVASTVGAADVAKGLACALAARRFDPGWAAALCAVAVCGHNWSPFLRGAGGRGVAPAIGALAVLERRAALVLAAGPAVGIATRRPVTAMTIAVVLTVPVVASLDGRRAAWTCALVLAPVVAKSGIRRLGGDHERSANIDAELGRALGRRRRVRSGTEAVAVNPTDGSRSYALSLRDPRALDVTLCGTKAARLAELRQAGFPVPDGVVLTTAAVDDHGGPGSVGSPLPLALGDVVSEARRIVRGRLAVRSSALEEDRPDASWAGLHHTVLGVRSPREVEDAVAACLRGPQDAAGLAALDAYGRFADADPPTARGARAVLLQRLVAARAAGVAFGADPLTGDRETVRVSAVRGLGRRLVDGEADAEEWQVSRRRARRDSGAGKRTIPAHVAHRVARTVRRIEARANAPVDVEWAWDGRRVRVLQARPMTAPPPQWDAPLPGGWLRDIRLGEWFPEPLTPLFATWVLPHLEESFVRHQSRWLGFTAPAPVHVCVHGWYFHSPVGSGPLRAFVLALLRSPRAAVGFALARFLPSIAHRVFLAGVTDASRAAQQVQGAGLLAARDALKRRSPRESVGTVESLADAAGEAAWFVTLLGGSAWRFEAALAAFCRRHLRRVLPDGHAPLLAGAVGNEGVSPEVVVHSLDCYWPAHDEQMLDAVPARRRDEIARRRYAAEVACRSALARRPLLRRRFDRLLNLARDYDVERARVSAALTSPWPTLRAHVLAVGEELCATGALDSPEDVFFLEAGELEKYLTTDVPPSLADSVDDRRERWKTSRRMSPPRWVGTPPRAVVAFLALAGGRQRRRARDPDTLTGSGAGPGRADGPARVILDTSILPLVDAGDILVVSALTPALVALYPFVAGVVADRGSLAAHAALTAREFGVPAVVGLDGATRRIRDGQRIVLDGAAGTVWIERPLSPSRQGSE